MTVHFLKVSGLFLKTFRVLVVTTYYEGCFKDGLNHWWLVAWVWCNYEAVLHH